MFLIYKQNISLKAGAGKKILLPKVTYVDELIFHLEFSNRTSPPKDKEVLIEAKNVFNVAAAKPVVVKNSQKLSVFNLKSEGSGIVKCSCIELTANCNLVINLAVFEG